MADSGSPAGPPDPSGPTPGPVFGFYEQGFNRVTRATKLVEKELVPAAVGRRGRYPIMSGGGGIRLAKSGASGIAKKTGATVPSADVALWAMDKDGNLTDTGKTAKCFNLSTTAAVGNNKMLIIVNVGGQWFADWEDC